MVSVALMHSGKNRPTQPVAQVQTPHRPLFGYAILRTANNYQSAAQNPRERRRLNLHGALKMGVNKGPPDCNLIDYDTTNIFALAILVLFASF